MTAPRTSRNTEPIVTYGGGGRSGVGQIGQYKRVRDMDYVKPPVIMRVKESGELYVPNPDKLHKGPSIYDIHIFCFFQLG